jgi:hypothetical protein
MSDPRQVQPQRAPTPYADDGDVCAHRYWCRTRITATVLAAVVLVGLVVGVWWWIR